MAKNREEVSLAGQDEGKRKCMSSLILYMGKPALMNRCSWNSYRASLWDEQALQMLYTADHPEIRRYLAALHPRTQLEGVVEGREATIGSCLPALHHTLDKVIRLQVVRRSVGLSGVLESASLSFNSFLRSRRQDDL